MLNELVRYLEQEIDLYGDLPIDLARDELQSILAKPLSESSETNKLVRNIENASNERTNTEASNLDELKQSLQGCKRCSLCEHRTQVVFGSGNQNADLMIIGEAPGAEEDIQGVPFVGKAGQLLTKMLEAIHISRNDVYIANIVKCRPQNNRDPLPIEMESCLPFLKEQIDKVKPKLILSLGRISGQTLTSNQQSLSSLRGRSYTYENTELLITYHPAALLRNPKWKRLTWEDLKHLKSRLDKIN